MARVAEEEGVGVVHTTGYKADVHAAWARGLGGRFGLVATVHGWLFRRWAWKERFYRAVDVAALKRFDRVVALSGFYEGVLRQAGFDPMQLARIPTGVEADSVATREEGAALWRDEGAPFTFGTLGRLSEEKDQALLVKAAGRLARRLGRSPRAWRVVVAGDGPLRERLERLAVAFPFRDGLPHVLPFALASLEDPQLRPPRLGVVGRPDERGHVVGTRTAAYLRGAEHRRRAERHGHR